MTAKALRRVEQLARIIATFDGDIPTDDLTHHVGPVDTSLAETVRELRLALVDLDIARIGDGAPHVA